MFVLRNFQLTTALVTPKNRRISQEPDATPPESPAKEGIMFLDVWKMLEFLVLEFQEEEKSESLPDGACEAGLF